MKNLFRYTLIPLVTFLFFSCKKDNYNQPGAFLTGAILYNNDTIYVERNQVPYQLYQYGFGKVGPIGASSAVDQNASPSGLTYFEQNGTYSQVLFNGDYKLIIPNGQGPFLWKQDANGNPDSLAITLKGNQTVNLEVTPYYMPRNGVASTTGRNVNASFKIEKIIKDINARDIDFVGVYINKTQFVSGTDRAASRVYSKAAILDSNKIDFTEFVPLTATMQNNYYVRLGIKMVNVEDMIFTPLLSVNLGDIDNYKRVEAETGKLIGNTKIDSINGSNTKYLTNINAVGDGVDVTIDIPVAGTYILNIGGGTGINGTTQTVYVDGNVTSAKTALYPNQGETNFDVSPVQFDLTTGNHVLSIRKAALDVGKANIDYVDLFRLK